MKARKKLVVALAMLLAASGSAFALGLGQIKVKSALNQPLVAEIPVVSATPQELRGLKVSLASDQAFQRAGINRARLQVPLEFKVEQRDGGTVIVITSDQPVGDPALDLLLELDWSNGKLLREYSILLDPPGLVAAESTPTRAPAATAPAAAATPARRQATASPRSGSATGSGTAASTRADIDMGSQYTVGAGDSAWSIARRATGAGSVNRMMLAIKRANPDAFYKDNINALKRGAVLRIPDRQALDRISASAAHDEVQRQNQVWSNPQAASPSVMAGEGTPSSSGAGADSAGGSADSRLELVPPGDANSSGAGRTGVAGGSGQAAVTGLKQELSRTKEALASEKQRSEDIASRLKDLEDIQDKNQRLLKMKNAEIARLQAALAKARDNGSAAAASTGALREDIFKPATAGSTAAKAAVPGSAMAPASSTPMTATAAAGSSAAPAAAASAGMASAVTPPSAATTTAAPSRPAAETARPAATAQAPAPSEQPWYMQTWAWIVGGLIIIALLLVGFMGSRGKSGSERGERLSSALGGDTHAGDEPHMDDSEDEYALLDEIEQHPDELSLHLELASLYYAHRNQDKFEGAAEAMYAHVDDPEQPEWQQVRAMGEELCPDHPLFAELHTDGAAAAEATPSAADDFDEDASLADLVGESETRPRADQQTEPKRAASSGDGGGYNFDFNLTPVNDEDEAAASADHGAQAGAEAEPEDTDADADEDEDLLSLSALDDEHDTGTGSSELDHADADDDADQDHSVTREHAVLDERPDVDTDVGSPPPAESSDDEGFSSDPVDTKLDLARAYQDMGDNEGARAMLEEVLQEGSEAQKDAARKLLDDLD